MTNQTLKASSSQTKRELMDAAEELFSSRGISGASLRHITHRAGTSLSSVAYHFGGKLGLLEATIGRRMTPLNHERVRLLSLATKAAPNGAPSLESILEAFVGPTLRLCREHPSFMRLLARVQTDASKEVRDLGEGAGFQTATSRFREALLRTLPGAGPDDLWWTITFLAGAMVHTWAKWPEMDTLSSGDAAYGGDEEILARLVEFGAAGIRASLGSGR